MKAVSTAGGSSDTPETEPETVSAPPRRNPTEPVRPTETETPTGTEPGADTEAGTGAETEAGSGAGAGVEAEAEGEAGDQARAGVGTDAAGAENKAGSGAERDSAADAEGAEHTVPADTNVTGTPAAGAEPEAEGEGAADREIPGSDSSGPCDAAEAQAPEEARFAGPDGSDAPAEMADTTSEAAHGGETAAAEGSRETGAATAATEVGTAADTAPEAPGSDPRAASGPGDTVEAEGGDAEETPDGTPQVGVERDEEGSAGAQAPDPAGGGRKLPSWARGVESDTERTSEFVALKDPDTPAPRTAAPTPAATPAATASLTAAETPAAPAAGRAPATPTAPPAPAAPTTPEPPAARTIAAPKTPAPAPAGRPVARPAPGPTAPARPAPATQAAPLELLAELTNTAPPPETSRRTAVRRVKVWTPILLLLAGAFAGAQLLRPLPAPTLVGAEPAHTIPGQFGIPWPAKGQGAVRVPGSGDIGTFGEQRPVPTASVAKVMTAYVVLKDHPLRKGDPGPDITVDAKAVADGTSEHESRIKGLTAGTKFSQQDMLKMLMIPSGNNVARLLARWDTGSDNEAAFVEKMNAAARELGMKDTTYTDPSGLDAATVSTAADQLRLAEAVMKDEAFRTIVAMPNATIKGLPEPIYNNNDTLLTASGLNIRGIKTGSSTPAGGALMWAANKSVGDETTLILGTLMDQHVDGPDPNAANSLLLVKANSKKIIEAVREALTSAPVVRKGQTVGYVDDGLGGRTPLVATKDLNVVGVPGQRLRLSLSTGASRVPHTARAGSEVAVLTVGDGEGAKSVPVAVRGELAEPSFGTRLTRLG
ncbi:serine hydrolase [Streptomyces sp. NPDC088762]|uniref:D-alanyl-D-alanine carboxypeptidase n=1 Tax=Streptomyces sp. NPDC088762 TaxID=3365891 RepID=UPI00381F2233